MSVLKTLLIASALTALAAPAFAQSGGVRVENAAARVVVIAENRSDYQISINQGRAGLKPLTIRHDGGVPVVDGGYGGGSFSIFHGHWGGLNCKGPTGHERVDVPGRGDVAVADLPVVTIHAPMNPHIGAGGAVYGEVNMTNGLDLANSGCGDWRVADVRGPVHIATSGSGDVHAGNVGEARVDVSGSSDVTLGAINGSLSAHTSGSGDVRAMSVHGELAAYIAGSSDVTVDGGSAPKVHASIAGSGDLKFRGEAGALSVSIAGSGDVDVARVTGPVSKSVVGSGEVHIGR